MHQMLALQWRHNGRDSVSNHQPHDCLLNRVFRRRSKKTSKLRVTGFCEGNSPGTGEFPAQMASYTESISIWWRHHVSFYSRVFCGMYYNMTVWILEGNYIIAVEIVKTNLNTPIWKAWGSASRAQRPLPTGIVRRQFPSLRGTTWCNNGSSTRNSSRFEHDNRL